MAYHTNPIITTNYYYFDFQKNKKEFPKTFRIGKNVDV